MRACGSISVAGNHGMPGPSSKRGGSNRMRAEVRTALMDTETDEAKGLHEDPEKHLWQQASIAPELDGEVHRRSDENHSE
mmetsp:Transcript_49455/g.118991  ORF Transcript_49455/g.118991 Transcript_49455/m.118991 type:complete len:80 (-) Transcript_49455:77-316(-)